MPRSDYHTQEPERRRNEHLLRRAVHIMSPLFLVYYWLDPVMAGVPKRFWVIAIALAVLSFEAARARFRWHVPGMRAHERQWISSAAMGGVGLAAGLLLFPPHLVAGCFAAMSWVDPVAGELRERGLRGRLTMVAAAYAAVFVVIQIVLFPHQAVGPALPYALIFGALAGVVGAFVEEESPKWLDDDLTMHLVPVMVLFPLAVAVGLDPLALP